MGQLSRQPDFLAILDELPEEAQDRVVDLVRCLASRGAVVSGKRLAFLVGTLDPEQARLMKKAIEEDCETVDPHGW